MGDIVGAQWRAEMGGESLDEGDDEGGGGTEAGTGWSIDERGDAHRRDPTAAEILRHPPRDARVQHEAGAGEVGLAGREGFLAIEIRSDEMDAPVRGWLDEGVGIAVDRGVEHGAAMLVAERAQIRATAGEAQAQRNAGADRRCHLEHGQLPGCGPPRAASRGWRKMARSPPGKRHPAMPAAAAAARSLS